jgi:hypothetical protein
MEGATGVLKVFLELQSKRDISWEFPTGNMVVGQLRSPVFRHGKDRSGAYSSENISSKICTVTVGGFRSFVFCCNRLSYIGLSLGPQGLYQRCPDDGLSTNCLYDAIMCAVS